MHMDDRRFSRNRVSFLSASTTCAGYLYTPIDGTDNAPCLLMVNGFSGTMDHHLPRYAERFANAGFFVMIFDYRFFGESDGQPRQLLSVRKQREDVRHAISFLRAHKQIDASRIVLWGTSLGGGRVIDAAAHDSKIAAVIAQVPGIDMVARNARATIHMPASMLRKVLAAAVIDGVKGALGLRPHYIKIFSDRGETAVFTDPKLKHRFDALMHSSKTWKNWFTPRFYLSPPRYKKGTIEKVSMPLLLCVADKDVYANPLFQEWIGKQAPKGEVRHYDAEHFDIYHDKVFGQVVEDQIAFVRRHVQ